MSCEKRFFATAPRIERRAVGEGEQEQSLLVGHAAVFDQWTTLYEGRYWTWREIVRPGAFRRAIAERQDVRALFNHDPNFVLGRVRSNTLELEEDGVGLMSRTLFPGTQTIRDLVVSPVERDDVTGMSFAFQPRRGDKVIEQLQDDGTRVIESVGERITIRVQGERRIEERELLDLDLFDVSVVTYPAYGGTDVDLRWVPDLRKLIEERDRPHHRPTPVLDRYREWLTRLDPSGARDE